MLLARSMYSTFRLARRKISGGNRLDRPAAKSSCECRSANDLITNAV